MKGFPQLPVMEKPFADNVGQRAHKIPATTQNVNAISYALGIPIAFSVPKSGGGSVIERQQFNRLVYDSTVGTYKEELGYFETFNPTVCENIGGYPKGAVLKWYKTTREDGLKMPESSAGNIMSEWPYFSTDKFPEYNIGDIVLNKSGSASDYSSYVFISTYDKDDQNRNEFSKVTAKINFETVIEVVSTMSGNMNDFRANGPTPENGWEALDSASNGFFPKYEDADKEDSIVARGSASRKIELQEVEIERNGWLLVECKREMSDTQQNTLGQAIRSFSDGVTVKVSAPTSTDPVLVVERQFGPKSSLSKLIPVSAGSRVLASVRNDMGVSVEISVKLLGRV